MVPSCALSTAFLKVSVLNVNFDVVPLNVAFALSTVPFTLVVPFNARL